MKKHLLHFFLLFTLLAAFSRCSKNAEVSSAAISDYYPVQVGKYRTYSLDSAVYINFGQAKEIRHHILKEIVDASITDNLGRPSFRIRRLLQSKTDTTQWNEHSTCLAIPLTYSLEFVEDNLRIIKLQQPFKEFFSWNGNRYLPDEAYPQFGFNSTAHSNLGTWEYLYENVDSSAVINGKRYDNTITVTCSIADSTNFPPRDKNGPAFKTVWEEKYAKGVGLISRNISLEEFQPRTSTYPNGYFSGFEVKQTLIEHN